MSDSIFEIQKQLMTRRKKLAVPTDPLNGLPKDMTAGQRSYLLAIESELEEQRLRALLYKKVLELASEQVGEDLLKKIGTQPSGP